MKGGIRKICALLPLLLPLAAAGQYRSEVWCPDNGDGTYTNPVIYADSPAIHIDIWLRMSVSRGECRFFYSIDGKRFKQAGGEFALRQGKWIGSKMGFVCERDADSKGNRGWLDIDWFRVGRLNLRD